MNVLRGVLGVLCLALGVWFLVLVFGPEDAAATPARTFTSSNDCRECHAEVFAEWEGSQHAISWTNPRVQFLSNEFANQDCIDCHAPRPVFVTGIGERVLPRSSNRPAGVDCLSCHQLPDGGQAGTRTDPRAPCRPVATLDLQRPDYCAGCHNQHKTVDQWRASEWPARDQDCLSCHMPFRDGDPNRGRDHTFPGGNDLSLLQAAVELRGAREESGWVVEIENVGAGHAYPTDERSRRSDVFWRPAGETTWRHLWRIRDPYRTETDIPSTLLHAHETKRLPIDDPDARGAVEVALFYMREPYWKDPESPDPDVEATLVHRIDLAP
jgi:hypothetical protein